MPENLNLPIATPDANLLSAICHVLADKQTSHSSSIHHNTCTYLPKTRFRVASPQPPRLHLAPQHPITPANTPPQPPTNHVLPPLPNAPGNLHQHQHTRIQHNPPHRPSPHDHRRPPRHRSRNQRVRGRKPSDQIRRWIELRAQG